MNGIGKYKYTTRSSFDKINSRKYEIMGFKLKEIRVL